MTEFLNLIIKILAIIVLMLIAFGLLGYNHFYYFPHVMHREIFIFPAPYYPAPLHHHFTHWR